MRPPPRASAAILGAAVVAGSVVLWLGVPYGCLWLVSLVSRDWRSELVLVLVTCPLAMFAFAYLLARLNALYVRASQAPAARLLEVSMTASAVVSLLFLVVWFAAHPHNPMPANFAP